MSDSFERFSIKRSDMLAKMASINPKNIEEIKDFRATTESIACPTYPYNGKMEPITYRQYAVAQSSFVCSVMENIEQAWWEICDFVEAGNGEDVPFLELQMICLMLNTLILAAEKEKQFTINRNHENG